MAEDELEVLITVVVAAEDDPSARQACQALLERAGGRIVAAGDCSDEDPGCWSVTISRRNGAGAGDAATLARTIRTFTRELGPDFATYHVSCEPPTAWTVLDDPELVGQLVPGGERLLVEAWAGGSPLASHLGAPVNADHYPDPRPIGDTGFRLRMRVDVAADRSSGAEWQARAVASRITEHVTITDTSRVGPGRIGVDLDLGPVDSPEQAVRDAFVALVSPGWDEHGWQDATWVGPTAVVRWVADPPPSSGITAVEISAGPTDS